MIRRDAPRAEQQEGIARLIFRDLVGRMLSYDPAQRCVLFSLFSFFSSVSCPAFLRSRRCTTTFSAPTRLRATSSTATLCSAPPPRLRHAPPSPRFFFSSHPPSLFFQVPAYGRGHGHARTASRQYTENALREAALLLDARFPGVRTQAAPPPGELDEAEAATVDIERSLNNMSISPREE